jgi:aldehyde dehydrogenase (NAD+)
VQESVYDALLDSLKRRMATLRIGDPLDKNTDLGAINSSAQLDRIRTLSRIGEQEGAAAWSPPCELPERGFWFAPTIFTGVTQAHRIAREEIFGPVLSVLTYDDEDDLVARANDSVYGLACGLWTRDYRTAWRVARRIDAGTVWINTYKQFSISTPFSGMKASGVGTDKGRDAILQYSRQKSIYWDLTGEPVPWGRH